MNAPTGTIAIQIPNSDGSITNLTGTLANPIVTTTPPPVIIPPPSAEPVIPANAQVVNMLLSKAWSCKHDTGTPGDANGIFTYPTTAPDGTPNCAEFNFSNIDKGGALYHANVMADATPFNTFCMEIAEFYPTAPTNLACMENDLEQVAASGVYVDMATQLDHYGNGGKGTFDYTENQKWVNSTVPIDPTKRKAGVWYTKRIYVKNIDGKNVLYMGVFLSDTNLYYPLGITVPSQPSAKWGPKLLNQQKQYVGLNMGTVNSIVYVKTLNTHCFNS
jgi:hypothetical protein